MGRFAGTLVKKDEDELLQGGGRFGGQLIAPPAPAPAAPAPESADRDLFHAPPEGSWFGMKPYLKHIGRTTAEAGEAAFGGFAESSAKPLYGALDLAEEEGLFNLLPDELTEGTILNKARRKEALEFAGDIQQQSPVGSFVGSTVGDVAKYALPGSMLKVLGKGLPAMAAADVAGAGVFKAAETPEERGGTRLKAGLTEAGYAFGGLAAGKVLQKTLAGIDKIKGAQKYIDQGGYLTPGQAAESTMVRGLETVAEVTPFLAKGTKEFRQTAQEGVSEQLINKVAKSIGRTTDDLPSGQQGMIELSDIVESGYKDAWKSSGSAWDSSKEARRWFSDDSIGRRITEWGDTEAAALRRLQKMSKDDGVDIKQMDKKLRRMMGNAEGDFLDTLGEIRAELRNFAGPKAKAALAKMDANYGDYLVLQDAAAKTPAGAFTADRLSRSARQVGGKSRAAKGRAPLQQESEDLAEIMMSTGGAPLEWFRRLAGAAPTPVPRGMMETAGNILIGETDPQRAARKMLENEDLRQYLIRSGLIVGAMEGDEDG